MLVLSRKTGESILLGDDIEVKILESKDGRVKVGIEAPRSVSVIRKEVLGTIEANKEAGKRAANKDELMRLMQNKK